MKTIYRIYRYDATVKIPRKDYNDDDCYTASEVERIIMEDAYKGDCFLHDNAIFETKSESEAEAKLVNLAPYSELRDDGESLEVTCYGVEKIECEIDEDSEVIDEEFIGGNWICAPVETEEEEN